MLDLFFADTFFFQAVLNGRDPYHATAIAWIDRVEKARVWTTEAVLTELGNAMGARLRERTGAYIAFLYQTANITVVPITPDLFQRGLALYRSRGDKEWGLTDCLSFVVMQDQNIGQALTGDRHFEQAGFEVVLLRD